MDHYRKFIGSHESKPFPHLYTTLWNFDKLHMCADKSKSYEYTELRSIFNKQHKKYIQKHTMTTLNLTKKWCRDFRIKRDKQSKRTQCRSLLYNSYR